MNDKVAPIPVTNKLVTLGARLALAIAVHFDDKLYTFKITAPTELELTNTNGATVLFNAEDISEFQFLSNGTILASVNGELFNFEPLYVRGFEVKHGY